MRFIIKFATVLIVCSLLGGGAFVLHQHRRDAAAREALTAGKTAYKNHNYTQAAAHLGRYLSVDSHDTELLLMYADAQVRRRPRDREGIQKAVNTWELILRQHPGHPVAVERLLEFYSAINSQVEVERIARGWLHASEADAAARLQARRRLLAALLAQRKLDEAQRMVEEWEAAAPDDAAALQARAEVLLARGQTDDAIAALQEALSRRPGDVDIGAQLAFLFASHRQDREAAERLVNELVERNPDSAEARLARARFYLYMLLTQSRPVAEDRTRAIEDLETVGRLAAKDADLLIALAELFVQVGLEDRAFAVLTRVESLIPDRPAIYDLQGRIALETGDVSAMVAVADRAAAAPLGDARLDILPTIAELNAAAGRLHLAEQAVQELRAADSSPETLLYLEAVIDLAANRPAEAMTGLREVIRRNPDHLRAHLLLGQALSSIGDLKRAADSLTHCIRLAKAQGRLNFLTRVQLETARLHARLQDWDAALEIARAIDLRLPDTTLANQAMLARMEIEAQVARRSGPAGLATLQRFQTEAEALIQRAPDYLPLRLLHARLLGWQGRVDEALARLKEVERNDTTRQMVALTEMEVLADAGRYEQAIALCQSAVEAASDEQRPALYARLVALLGASGDQTTTEDQLRNLAENAPAPVGVTARLELARLLVRRNEPDEAREILRQMVREDPSSLPACLLLLELTPREGGDPSRQELANNLKTIEGPDGLHARYWQALVWLESDQWADHRGEIESLLNKCLAEDPTWQAPVLALGSLYEKAGESEKAMAAIRTLPGSAAVWRAFTQAALAAGDREQALERVEQGLAVAPNDADLLLIRSQLLLERSPHLAATAARQAFTLQPDNEQAVVTLAAALARIGNLDEAGRLLTSFLSRPDLGPRVLTRLELARVSIRKQDFQTAQRLIDEAGRLAPGDASVIRLQIEWHRAQKHWDQIATLASTRIQEHPDDVPTVRMAAHALIGSGRQPYQQTGLELLRGCIAAHPGEVSGYVQLGSACFALGRYDEARSAYEQVVRLDPRNVNAFNDLAWIVCEHFHDPETARVWGQKALDLAPDNPHILDTWGVINYRLGRYEESREALRQCLISRKIAASTKAAATFHLARTLAELDWEAGYQRLQQLLDSPAMSRDLSEVSRAEARALLNRLSATTTPAS